MLENVAVIHECADDVGIASRPSRPRKNAVPVVASATKQDADDAACGFRTSSLQNVQILDQVIDILAAQALVESRHRAPAFDDGFSHLGIRGRGAAGQHLKPE